MLTALVSKNDQAEGLKIANMDVSGTKLSCGAHLCPQKCHQLADHSKIQCLHIEKDRCPQNHKLHWHCWKGRPTFCSKCEALVKEQEAKLKRDFDLEEQRKAKEAEFKKQLEKIDGEIRTRQQEIQDRGVERDRAIFLLQRAEDLAGITSTLEQTTLYSAFPTSYPAQSNPSANAAVEERDPPTAGHSNQGPSPSTTNLSKYKKDKKDQAPAQKPRAPSAAVQTWEHQKTTEGASNAAIESIMQMIGLDDVQQRFLNIKSNVETIVRQGTDLKAERFGAVLLGNPGTGKTTVARLYAKLLASVGILPGEEFVEVTGSSLANSGVGEAKKLIEKLLNAGGGAFFIDEAYQLVSSHNFGGAAVLDYLLAEIENQTGKIVFVMAGYNKEMEAFFEHNPGLPSRIPKTMQFRDYKDDELLSILRQNIEKLYSGKMHVEEGLEGLYMRIVARRIGRGRQGQGFANAREVQNVFARIRDRQTARIPRDRQQGLKPDDFLLTKEDLIGPVPSTALTDNAAWKKLQSLCGLRAVKDSVAMLLSRLQSNYERELKEKPIIEASLNKLFIGSPGTGKTSVAKLYGQILADIGLLSNGEGKFSSFTTRLNTSADGVYLVVIKNPSDFIGGHLGQSETQTKAILASTIGKVLIIDEAYSLSGGATSNGTADMYRTAVIDTLVAEVQSTAGENRCVLLLGYREQMEEMLQNSNPGLARRFPLASAFVFEDFDDDELAQILELKLKDQGFDATAKAKEVALEVLKRARNRPNFGNAGEVDIILDRAKAAQQQRLSKDPKGDPDMLEPQDIDKDYERGTSGARSCRELFEGVIGCEATVSKLERYQQVAMRLRERGLDPRDEVPFNFLFRGPPGKIDQSLPHRVVTKS